MGNQVRSHSAFNWLLIVQAFVELSVCNNFFLIQWSIYVTVKCWHWLKPNKKYSLFRCSYDVLFCYFSFHIPLYLKTDNWLMLTLLGGDNYTSSCNKEERKAHIMFVCDRMQAEVCVDFFSNFVKLSNQSLNYNIDSM